MKGALIGDPGAFGRGLGSFADAGLELAVLPDGEKAGAAREELFSAPGLEFAAVSLPPEEGFGAALSALERGLHLVCAPPFCRSTTELETLRLAAEKTGRVIFPVQPWERAAPWLALQKALDRALAGEINYAAVEMFTPGPAPAGGAVSPEGWQALAMLLASVRRPPVAVEARNPGGTPAALHAHFGGADGFVHLSWGAHKAHARILAAGDKGRIEAEGGLLRLDIEGLPPETVEFSSELLPGAWRPEWLKAELEDFRLEAAGKRPRGAGLRNTRYCVKLLKNAFYSASVKSAAVPL